MKTKFYSTQKEQETAFVLDILLGPDSVLTESEQQSRLDEAIGLTRAIDLDVLFSKTIPLKQPNAGYLISKGHRDMVLEEVERQKPNVIIVNFPLSPVQQRNLEREWGAKVIDRTGLILEIFGARAQTKEGRIQVELAALDYQKSRLVRSWTHLERQRGGAGFMGGPGERQIELDRRIITDQITKLKKQLKDVRRTRELGRKSRERIPFPTVALVGYTNAGKSTLFNALTGADVMAEDMLFATLDPTMRKIKLQGGQTVILSDTVGFISDLPTHLIEAFQATLEQVEYADIILHVRDVSQPDSEQQRRDVIQIMEDLGVPYEDNPKIIEVLNKIDRLPDYEDLPIFYTQNQIYVSAETGRGLPQLLQLIEKTLKADHALAIFEVPHTDGKALAWLYENGEVLHETSQGDHKTLHVQLPESKRGQFENLFAYNDKG